VVICLEQGADCFSYGPADASAIPKPHHLLPRLNPDWFYFSGCPRKEAVKRANVVVVAVCMYVFIHLCIYLFCLFCMFS